MRSIIIAATLAIGLAGCSGPETRADEPWEAENPDDSTEAFDQRLREKHLKDAESMERARVVAASLAAKRGKTLQEVVGADAAGGTEAAAPAAGDRQPCPPDSQMKFTCRCTGGPKPPWTENLGPAWKDRDGAWYAVGQAPAMKDANMAANRAFQRALTKIAAALGGQPGFKEAPPKRIKAFLQAAESRDVHREQSGEVFVLARYGLSGPIPDAVTKAKCPKMENAPYACDCPAGQQPAWLYLQAWRGGDGFAYGAGTSPGTSARPLERARLRARRSLMVFLVGLCLQAESTPDGKRHTSSLAQGSLDEDRVQVVTEQDHGKGKAVLVRYWIGE